MSESSLWNFQVKMLNTEVRRETWAKDRDLDVKRTEGAAKVMGMNECAQLECPWEEKGTNKSGLEEVSRGSQIPERLEVTET